MAVAMPVFGRVLMRSIPGWMEQLEPRVLLSASTSHVKPPVFNYYAGSGTINNAINGATAGGTLAPTAPALPAPLPPVTPLVSTLVTTDALNTNAPSLADLVVDGVISNQPIVIGTNSNVGDPFNSSSEIGLSSP